MTGSTTPTDSLRLEFLTREELRTIASTTTVIVPTGSTEQHSTHLPLAVDTLIVSEIALRAAATLREMGDPVTVAPAVPYGFSHHHFEAGGAISIGIRVYIDFVSEIVRSLTWLGFPRVVLLNGHGGNDEALRVVANRIVFEEQLPVTIAMASYWDIGREALATTDVHRVGPVPGHAGGFETSCLLAIRPELVRLDRRPLRLEGPQPLTTLDRNVGGLVRRPGLWGVSHGFSDNAAGADAGLGTQAVERLTEAAVQFIHNFIRTELPESSQAPAGEKDGRAER